MQKYYCWTKPFLEHSALNKMYLLYAFSQGWMIYVEEEVKRLQEPERNCVFQIHIADAQMNSWWQHTQVLYKYDIQKIPTQKSTSGHKVPSLNKNLFPVDSCWERENQFSSKEWYWEFILCSKPHSQC